MWSEELAMLRTVIGAIAGALLVTTSVSSCVVNDASIVILGLMAPPTTSSSGSSACVYQATITGPFENSGVMDVAFAEGYTPVLLLGNQLVAQGNGSLDRIETNNINIEGAVVTVTDSGGATLDSYTVFSAGFLLPSSGGTPGLDTYAVTIVSPKAADAARQQLMSVGGTKRLVSNVKVFGNTTGGTHIESGVVTFSVDACYGCLVTFPAGSDDPTLPMQPNCSASASSSGGSSISPPCVFGQDQYVDCRLCAGTNPVCQP
jgi:hypothetical protein